VRACRFPGEGPWRSRTNLTSVEMAQSMGVQMNIMDQVALSTRQVAPERLL